MLVLKEVDGDLFENPDSGAALAHCISEDCRMGKGIATMFKKMFGGVAELQKQVDNGILCKERIGGKTTGSAAVLHRGDRFVYYLITKKVYSDKPTYDDLQRSLKDMRHHMTVNGVDRVVIPRIGCGLDRLKWEQVKTIVEKVFTDSNVRITVYSGKCFPFRNATPATSATTDIKYMDVTSLYPSVSLAAEQRRARLSK